MSSAIPPSFLLTPRPPPVLFSNHPLPSVPSSSPPPSSGPREASPPDLGIYALVLSRGGMGVAGSLWGFRDFELPPDQTSGQGEASPHINQCLEQIPPPFVEGIPATDTPIDPLEEKIGLAFSPMPFYAVEPHLRDIAASLKAAFPEREFGLRLASFIRRDISILFHECDQGQRRMALDRLKKVICLSRKVSDSWGADVVDELCRIYDIRAISPFELSPIEKKLKEEAGIPSWVRLHSFLKSLVVKIQSFQPGEGISLFDNDLRKCMARSLELLVFHAYENPEAEKRKECFLAVKDVLKMMGGYSSLSGPALADDQLFLLHDLLFADLIPPDRVPENDERVRKIARISADASIGVYLIRRIPCRITEDAVDLPTGSEEWKRGMGVFFGQTVIRAYFHPDSNESQEALRRVLDVVAIVRPYLDLNIPLSHEAYVQIYETLTGCLPL